MAYYNDQPNLLSPAARATLRHRTIRILSVSSLTILVVLAFAAHLGIVPLPGEESYPHHLQSYSPMEGSFSAQIPDGWRISTTYGRTSESFLQTTIITCDTFVTIHDPIPYGMQIFVAYFRPENPAAWLIAVNSNQVVYPSGSNRIVAGYQAHYYPIVHDTFGVYQLATIAGGYQISFRPAQYHYLSINSPDPVGNINNWLHHQDPQQRFAFAQQVYEEFVASFKLGSYPSGNLVC